MDNLHLREEGLEDLFKEALSNGIKFTTEYQKTGYPYHFGTRLICKGK